MTAAIYYHPEAYTTTGPKLMGRNAAGESFIRGFFQHSQTDKFWAQVQTPEHGLHFAQALRQQGRPEPVKLIDKASLLNLSDVGCIYYPGPGISEHAYHRALVGAGMGVSNPHTTWSLCGITHTTSSAGAMDALVEIVTAPVQPWDAIICTSSAVKDNVQRILQSQVNYLQERLGISKMVLPMLPVIPLGIHTQDFNFSNEQKAEARKNLGVDQDTLVVLFMGRLSFHAKAHPLAMYQALQNAASQVAKNGGKILLLECGWHANEFIEKAYQDAAKLACPDVKVMVLDGRVASARQLAWAGADVFCSLSDNIQETFGIVPIEAMAAGLPVVVSDWDGYKDTVRDGVDGFRIPTCMPEFGLASDLAFRHALEIDTYDMYCGHTCSLVSVDIDAASKAFINLFESPSLRRQMGEQGRMRAKQFFDWSNVITQYESLWREQAQIRISAKSIGSKNLEHSWPARMDPFHAFASYPTNTLKLNSFLILVDASADIALKRLTQYKQLSMVNFAKLVLPSDEEIFLVLSVAQNGATIAENLLSNIEPIRKPFVFRSLVWLIKMGVLRLT